MPRPRPFDVLIAGAGVAGLEAALALADLAGDQIRLTLLDPAHELVLRPMSVAAPFAAGAATRYPLGELVRRAGAAHVHDGLAAVDPERQTVMTTSGGRLRYDALVVAVGALARPAYDLGVTFDPDDPEPVAEVVRDVRSGAARRVAVVVPPPPHWVLPGYELALLLAHAARGPGSSGTTVTLVTPEAAPLALFGHDASTAVATDLEAAGVEVVCHALAEVRPGMPLELVLHPRGHRLEADRVVALPVIRARSVPGLPAGHDGFLDVDEHGRVDAVEAVYAAGDITALPVKQGGLAAQQADAVARHVAATAGAPVEPAPFRAVLRGRLITGRADRWLRRDAHGPHPEGEVADHCLWWPPGKVAGRWLAPCLEELDDEARGFPHPPASSRPVEVTIETGPPMPVPRDLELLARDD